MCGAVLECNRLIYLMWKIDSGASVREGNGTFIEPEAPASGT